MSTPGEPRKVVGLRYEPEHGLPQVVLKGAGPLADAILQQRAAGRRAPVVRNDALLEQLYRLPVEASIGPELYRVVAILLVHVFAVEALMKGEHN